MPQRESDLEERPNPGLTVHDVSGARVTERVKRRALELGFQRVGISRVEPFVQAEADFKRRIEDGYLDGTRWMTSGRAEVACRPGDRLPWAKSIVSLAVNYYPGDHGAVDGGPHGRVARYAWGEDYHHVLKSRLRLLADEIAEITGAPAESAVYVDDSPFAEREASRRAGVGWFGKHTNVLVPGIGSWILLAEVLTAAELEPDQPLKKHCGTCSACIVACPTGAIVAPYVLDGRRCISYLTIEHDGPIPLALRRPIGTWIFGCDVCQEVCPVNRRVAVTEDPAFAPGGAFGVAELTPLLQMDEETFRARFRGAPFFHAKRRRIQRNACVALGNLRDRSSINSLRRALLENDDATVRSHAAWALGEIGTDEAAELLRGVRLSEDDPDVLAEAAWALLRIEQRAGRGVPVAPRDTPSVSTDVESTYR